MRGMIDAAIVGLGWWGQVLVNAVQRKSRKIRFVKGATRTRARAAEFAAQKGFALAESLDELLADRSIRALAFATPHSQHAEQIVRAAAAGKHAFVEKPFTLTLESAKQAVRAAQQAGIVLALGHNRRFHPNMIELRRRIQDGRMGTVLHCETTMSAPNGLYLPRESWRVSRAEAPAGGLTGLGIHGIDSMIFLFGTIAEAHCRSVRRAVPNDVDDTTLISLGFENGMTGGIACMTASAWSYRFAVYGTKGIAEITGLGLDHLKFTPALPPGKQLGPGDIETIDATGFDTVLAELDAFADAIEGKAPYPIPHEEMVHGIGVFEAVIRAAASGRSEPVLG